MSRKKIFLVILYNLLQIICVILFGLLFGFSYLSIFIILSTWICIRLLISAIYKVKILHYKNPIKCFIATLLLFVSIYLANKVDMIIGMFVVLYTSIFLSNLGNVGDIFQWYNNGDKRSSKYKDLIDLIHNDPYNEIIMKHEEYWRENYPTRYVVFVEFFRKRKKYRELANKLSLKDNALIRHECKVIYSSLEIPLNLKTIGDSNRSKQSA